MTYKIPEIIPTAEEMDIIERLRNLTLKTRVTNTVLIFMGVILTAFVVSVFTETSWVAKGGLAALEAIFVIVAKPLTSHYFEAFKNARVPPKKVVPKKVNP